jgi:hypothetical protein
MTLKHYRDHDKIVDILPQMSSHEECERPIYSLARTRQVLQITYRRENLKIDILQRITVPSRRKYPKQLSPGYTPIPPQRDLQIIIILRDLRI